MIFPIDSADERRKSVESLVHLLSQYECNSHFVERLIACMEAAFLPVARLHQSYASGPQINHNIHM